MKRRKKLVSRAVAERYTNIYGGRIFLHRAGRLGYQPHLLRVGGGSIVRIRQEATDGN